jgi:signal transduction histidine kinase
MKARNTATWRDLVARGYVTRAGTYVMKTFTSRAIIAAIAAALRSGACVMGKLGNDNALMIRRFYNITPHHHRRLFVDDIAHELRHSLGYAITYAELFAICEGSANE